MPVHRSICLLDLSAKKVSIDVKEGVKRNKPFFLSIQLTGVVAKVLDVLDIDGICEVAGSNPFVVKNLIYILLCII